MIGWRHDRGGAGGPRSSNGAFHGTDYPGPPDTGRLIAYSVCWAPPFGVGVDRRHAQCGEQADRALIRGLRHRDDAMQVETSGEAPPPDGPRGFRAVSATPSTRERRHRTTRRRLGYGRSQHTPTVDTVRAAVNHNRAVLWERGAPRGERARIRSGHPDNDAQPDRARSARRPGDRRHVGRAAPTSQ